MQINYQQHSISRTVSIGVACMRHAHTSNEDELLVQADQALYQAKEAGRNRTVLYSAEPE